MSEKIRGFSFTKPLTVQLVKENSHRCQLCGIIDEQLLSTPCDHTFCPECIKKCENVIQCPVHRSCYSPSQISPNLEIQNGVRQSEVYCTQKEFGCNRTSRLQDLEKHLTTCGFVQVLCPCDCGEKVCRRELAFHLTQTCNHRLISCQHCEEEISIKDEDEHLEHCPKKPIVCPYCNEQILYNQVNQHELQCLMKPRICNLATSIGCTFQGTIKELEDHQRDVQTHLELAIKSIMDGREMINNIAAEMKSVVEKLDQFKIKAQELSALEEKVTSMKTEIDSVLLNKDEEIKKLNENITEMKKEINSLKEELRREKQKILVSNNSIEKRNNSNSHIPRQKISSPPTSL
ncbi:TNF receptor-associated factor 6-like [Centruroides vittatus]|uniref:TNF receptor-associated factor 6-like n=1 Tax=Centruroides vittatus TaxID=120091 RepID=UPI0035107D11